MTLKYPSSGGNSDTSKKRKEVILKRQIVFGSGEMEEMATHSIRNVD